MMQNLPDITQLLRKMSIAFLCGEGGAKFVTSDDPCNLFNPDLQWQQIYGPGLTQKNVQLTLPLSPDIMLCMSWVALRGYMWWSKSKWRKRTGWSSATAIVTSSRIARRQGAIGFGVTRWISSLSSKY